MKKQLLAKLENLSVFVLKLAVIVSFVSIFLTACWRL